LRLNQGLTSSGEAVLVSVPSGFARASKNFTFAILNYIYFGYNQPVTESLLKDRPITIREALIPYFMTAINMLSPILAAMSLRLLSKEIIIVSLLFTIVGLPMSIFFRQQRYNKYLLNILVMLPLIFISWTLLKDDPAFRIDLNNPIMSLVSLSIPDAARGLLRVFVLLGAGRAFVLVTSRDLSESPISGIAIFLLTAATNPIRDLSIFFVIALVAMLISSLYLMAQDHMQQWFTIHTPFRIQKRLMTWALITTLIIFPFSILGGLLLSPVNFHRILRKYEARRYPNMSFGNPFSKYNLGNDESISMGSIDWPNGNQEMLRVEVEDRTESSSLLWRSATFGKYEGGKWIIDKTQFNVDLPEIAKGRNGYGYVVSPDTDPGILQAVKQKKMLLDKQRYYTAQKVTMLTSSSNEETPLYAAALPYKLFVQGIKKYALRQRYDGNLVYNQPTPVNSEYIIFSLLKPSPTEFISDVKLSLPKDREELYLQMPDEQYRSRVRTKALEILKERTSIKNDYDKIKQLSIYMSQNYSYTLKPEEPKGKEDPILNFLETNKRGYCVYFSGAYVMLCRSLGFPARMATGFATGEQDTTRSLAGRVTFLAKSSDAHAWVEVFLPNYGWLTVDPTSGSIREVGYWETVWDNIVSGIKNFTTFTKDFIASLKTSETARWYALLTILGILAILGAIAYFTSDRQPLLPRKDLTDEEAAKCVMKMYIMMLLWFKHWGITKPEGVTATEFDELLQKLSPDMAASAGLIINYYLKGKYSSIPLNNTDATNAILAMREIWRLSKLERKRIYEQDAKELEK
jgi:transglutaminase-like putative cysteine protease